MYQIVDDTIRYVCEERCRYEVIAPDQGDRERYCKNCRLPEFYRSLVKLKEKEHTTTLMSHAL